MEGMDIDQMHNMEDMDIDKEKDVPDTPDRLADCKINVGEEVVKEYDSSAPNDLANSDSLDKRVPNWLRGNGRLTTENRNNRRLFSHSRNDLSACFATEQDNSSSVCKNDHLFRRIVADKASKHEPKHSAHMEHTSSSNGHGGSNLLIHRAKLSGNSFGTAEVLAPDVKIQDETRGKISDLISSEKVPSSFNYKCRSTGRKIFPGNENMDKGIAMSAEVPFRHFACEDENRHLDLTARNEFTGIPRRDCPHDASKDLQAEKVRKGSIVANGCSHLHSIENSSKASSNASKGKKKTDDDTSSMGLDHGKVIDSSTGSEPKTKEIMSRYLHSIPSRRNSGQKRLVRNGCISPYNIARAKQSAENGNSSTDGKQDDIGKVISDGPSCPIEIVSPNSEGIQSDRGKGKGVISYPHPSEEHDAKTIHLSSSSLNRTTEANGTKDASGDAFRCFEEIGGQADGTKDASGDAFRCFEEIHGQRSTRNHSMKTSSPVFDEVGRLSRSNDGLRYVLDEHHENRDNMDGGNNSPEVVFLEDRGPVAFQHGPGSRLVQASSNVRCENGRHGRAYKLMKRQKKHGSARSGGYSTLTFDDSRVVCLGSSGESSNVRSRSSKVAFLGSSGESSNARSTSSCNPHCCGISGPVVEIDELSPEIRCTNPQDISRMVDHDSDVRERQVEADEILARQLQEQFYYELPGVGGGEIDASIAWTLQQAEDAQHASSRGNQHLTHPIDASIAWALQQEEDAHHASSRGNRHISHPRDSSMSHLYRQYPPRSFQNPSVRSGNRAGVPTSTRMARSSSSFLSQPPTTLSLERSFQFPPNMDLDMRLHILEALEAAVGTNDFNENDYETLLALDENNHQHGGASLNQINVLPQSTVQTDNFEEACAICLETPTTGDTIRHLPCLHKFHKDCIDPWLTRRRSCPICKSDIT